MIWKSIVRLIGGYYEANRLIVTIHDRGITVAWDQLIWKEWRLG